MIRTGALKIVAAVSALALAGGAQAATLYTQAALPNGGASASQNDTGANGNFATVFDDFTLSATSNITGLNFTGQFFNPNTSVGPISGFTVNFYSDAAGAPGSTLASSFTTGTAGQSCTGVVCNYSLALNFNADAGTRYWMSIVPDLLFPPQWGWNFGSGGNGVAYQTFFGTTTQQTRDYAFTLTGNAVPEPATWAMMIAGFGIIGGALRRRRTGVVATA